MNKEERIYLFRFVFPNLLKGEKSQLFLDISQAQCYLASWDKDRKREMPSCPGHNGMGMRAAHLDSGGCAKMGFKVVLGRAGAPQEIRWGSGKGRAAQNREEDPSCARPHLQVGSGGLGLQNSLWRPPGLAQESLLKHSIPLEEGLIDLRRSWGWGCN